LDSIFTGDVACIPHDGRVEVEMTKVLQRSAVQLIAREGVGQGRTYIVGNDDGIFGYKIALGSCEPNILRTIRTARVTAEACHDYLNRRGRRPEELYRVTQVDGI
jgi:hypothetical protein